MRQFLALELPASARQELGRVQSIVRERCTGWRWIAAQNIHLTIRFLGEIDGEMEVASRQTWRQAAAGVAPFRLTLDGLGCFPPRGKPRVLWIGIRPVGSAEPMKRLARRVERAARDLGLAPEERPFRPHLTLALAARGAQPKSPSEVAVSGIQGLRFDALVLFRSQLSSVGARYTALDAFPFEGAPESGAAM